MNSSAESSSLDDMEIAPGYTVADWKALDLSDSNDEASWGKGIDIFATRIRRRFIDPVDVLIAHEIGLSRGAFGFAILAIDCLLVETLQRFREGQEVSGKSGCLTRTFLSEQLHAHFDDGSGVKSKAGEFYSRCRCALHHSGQTDGDFRVRRSGPMIEFRDDTCVVVNRTAFHDAVKRALDCYLGELAKPTQGELRENFRKKMNAICGLAADVQGE